MALLEESARGAERSQDKQRLLDALEASGTGLWHWAVREDSILWTPESFRIHGLPESALQRITQADYVLLVHPEDRDLLLDSVNAALASRGEFVHEYRIVRPDGSVRWIESRGRAVDGEDGQPVHMHGSIRDITEQKHVQLAWRDGQERLSLTVEASGTGLWTWDLASDHVTWTTQCYRIHGLSEDAFDNTGAAFFALVHPEDRERLDQSVRSAVAANQPFVAEFRIVRPDGEIAWVANRGRARYDANGRPVSMLGTITDITPSKEAGFALQAALAAGRTGTFRWDIRKDTLAWDEELDKLFGLEPGSTVRSLAKFIALVHPEDRQAVIDACERCRSEGADFEMEFRVVRPDGSEHWLYDRGVTYRDHLNRPAFMTGACVDVTQRKAVEHALRLTEQRFRVAVEASSDILWTNDPHGRMLGEQPGWAAYTGQPFEEYQGYGWSRAVHPDDAAASVESWRACVAAGGKYVFEHRVRRHDGVYRSFAIRALPVRDEDGSVREWVGVHTDITELREAQRTIERQNQELRQADERKDVFLATLSHELRNPLAPIRTAAEVLANPALDSSRLAWTRDVIQRQVRHMALLLDDLLDVARITQGKLVLRRELLPFDGIVASAVEAVRPQIDRKQHRLSIDLPSPVPTLFADAVRLSQVIANLLGNAAKYTDSGGQIGLTAAVQDGYLRVDVRDNGIGLAPEAIPLLFRMFSQVTDPGRSEGGLGIGLALVRGLVDLHGGRIEARSDGPGRGSTFTVHLPLAHGAALPVGGAPAAAPAPKGASRRVLVVDDNADAAETLGTLLDLDGHVVRTACDGASGIRAAREFQPDVAFIDIGMPGQDGYAVARILREHPDTSRIVLVAVTGWGQGEDRERARQAGFSLHLTKPVDPQEIQLLLRHLAV